MNLVPYPKQIAERNQETLDELPDDTAGKIKELEKYEFLNPDAQRKFLELLEDSHDLCWRRRRIHHRCGRPKLGELQCVKQVLRRALREAQAR